MAAPAEGRPERGAMRLSELTPHLVCPLCGGYYIDATAIVECLHTFCRSCIMRHLETSSYCPALTCDVMIHRTKGAVSLRPDATLQSIVYKTVPGLHRDEMRRRQLFYADKPEADGDLAPALKGCYEEGTGRYYAPDDTIDVRIQYASHSPEEVVPVRYLRCPAGLPLSVLKKFLFQKYGFSDSLQMELIHGRKVLPPDIKLLDVAYIINWSRKSALKLLFRISKPKIAPKRKASAVDAAPSAVPSPKKTRKVSEGAPVTSRGAACVPVSNGGSERKTDAAKPVNKARSSAAVPPPAVRNSPSTTGPQSSRVTGQPTKSGERPSIQPVTSAAVTSQKTGPQPPAPRAAEPSRTEKPRKPEKSPQNVVIKPKTSGSEPMQRTNNGNKNRASESNQVAKPQVKSPTVRLNQVTIKAGQKTQKSVPQSSSQSPSQKSPAPRPPGTQLGHSYLACKMAMKLAASAANSKANSSVRSVSVGSMTRDDSTENKKNPVVNSPSKASGGTPSASHSQETCTAVTSVVSKPPTENKLPPRKIENGGTSTASKAKPTEKKATVSKVDCSVQTVPIYRIHSSKQNAVKSTKMSSHGTNTLLSTTPRKPQPTEQASGSKLPDNSSKSIANKAASHPPADAKEKPTAKVLVSRPTSGVLDLSTHARETPSGSGTTAAKDSKTIFVISGTKKTQNSKIQSIVESLAQKRLVSSSPTQPQNGGETSTAPSKSPPTSPKTSSVSTNGTFVAPGAVPARSAAATPVRPVSSPLHIETASLGLRYGSTLPPLPSLSRAASSSTSSTSCSSRPVFPVPPLPQRPKSQSVRSIPNPSLVRQRSAEERARDCGKGSPTAGSTAPAMSPPAIRDIHSLTRQLQEAGTSVTITNTTC